MFADCRIFVLRNGVDVRLYSQHNLHHTDHMRIIKQRTADLQVTFRSCSNLLLTKAYGSHWWLSDL